MQNSLALSESKRFCPKPQGRPGLWWPAERALLGSVLGSGCRPGLPQARIPASSVFPMEPDVFLFLIWVCFALRKAYDLAPTFMGWGNSSSGGTKRFSTVERTVLAEREGHTVHSPASFRALSWVCRTALLLSQPMALFFFSDHCLH